MKLTNQQKWLRLLVWLRREFPLRYPITVRSKKMKDNDGTTDFIRGRFLIEIEKHTSHTTRVDSILHEWAHAISWFGGGHYEDHPDEWGLAFVKVYRSFLEWDYGREKCHA